MTSRIQSVLFNGKYFTIAQAMKWIADHGFRAIKMDVTKNYYRVRQFTPSKFKQHRRTKTKYQKEIKFVIEF